MLRGTVAFLVLVACAVLGAELRRFLARRGFRAPAMEALSYLLIGLALGESALGLFPAELLRILRAVVLFGLAWIGLVFGLQVDLRLLRRLKVWHRCLGFLVPTFLGVAVLAPAVLLGLPLGLACGIAAVAAVPTASPMEGLARSRVSYDRAARRLLVMVMACAGIPAVFGFHAALGLWAPTSELSGGPLPAWHLVAAVLGFGVVAGYALVALLRGRRDSIEILTVLAGSMAAVAGAAATIGLSPVAPAAVVGSVVVNRSVFPHRVLKVAHAFEQPMLVALLVLVGASWTGIAFAWPVFLLMAPWRAVACGIAGVAMNMVARQHGVRIQVALVGAGLLPQGELALGLLVALLGIAGSYHGVLEAVLAAFAFNHLLGQLWLRRVLFRTAQTRLPTMP